MTTDVVARTGPRWWATMLYVAVIAAVVGIASWNASGLSLAMAIVLGGLACAAVVVRARWPYAFVVVAWAMALAVTQMLLLPALFSLGVRRRTLVSAGALVVTVGVLGVTWWRGERLVSFEGSEITASQTLWAWVLNVIAVVAVPYLLGVSVAVRRDLMASFEQRAVQAEQERAAVDREAVLLERQRIASEVHDILGHKLALISMQAGALEMTADGSPEVERQATRIGLTARQGMADLRTIIGMLDAPDSQTLGPRDLGDVQMLLEQSTASGGDVSLDAKGLSSQLLPEEVSRAGFRIVQEAVTNAHRHAPGARVSVVLSGRPGGSLEIDVRNPVLSPTSVESLAVGRGVPGLKERARSVGGRFAVDVVGDEFVAHGVLPWPPGTTRTS